jgi:hypothetical protein
MSSWLEAFPADFRGENFQQDVIRAFGDAISVENAHFYGRFISKIHDEHLLDMHVPISLPTTTTYAVEMQQRILRGNGWLGMDSRDFAEQSTLIDSTMLCQILPNRLILHRNPDYPSPLRYLFY